MLTEKIFAIAQQGAEAVLWLLLIISVISLARIFERFLVLGTIKRRSQKVQKQIRELLQSHKLDEIEDLARDRDCLEGRALAYGLRHVKENGSKGLEEIFNTFVLVEKPHLERALTFLATIGNNAPFIGLFGTVLGIMRAFHDLSMSEAANNKAVMSGIAEALVATAVGLVVAIPAVMAFNYFQKEVKRILLSIESVKELCLAYAKSKGH